MLYTVSGSEVDGYIGVIFLVSFAYAFAGSKYYKCVNLNVIVISDGLKIQHVTTIVFAKLHFK